MASSSDDPSMATATVAARTARRAVRSVRGTTPWAGVVRRCWLPLLLALGLLYGAITVALVATASLGKGLVVLEADLFTSGEITLWLGLVAYVQGVVLLGAAVVVPVAGFLALTTELARRSVRGERVAIRRLVAVAVRRSPLVAIGLVLVAVRAIATIVLAGVLLALSVVSVPLAALTAITWLVRPGWRRSWMRRPLVAAAPLGILVDRVVRWSLWLPYVVDGVGPRAGLRASRTAVAGRWATTAAPFLGVASIGVAITGVATVLARAGAPDSVATVGRIGAAVFVLVGATITAAVLHDRFEVPPPRLPRPWTVWGTRVPRVAVVLVLCLTAQGLVFAGARPAAADPLVVVVNTLGDAAEPDLGVECTTSEAPCSLRAAIEVATAAGNPETTIGFSVSGSIALVGTLWIPAPMTIDGEGQRVAITNGGAGRLLQIGGGFGEEPSDEGSGPLVVTLRNLTFSGGRSGDGAGVLVAAGDVLIDQVTFVDNITAGVDTLGGGAIMSAGTLEVRNSTFSGNLGLVEQPDGGTILNLGELLIVNSTFVGGHGVGSIFEFATTEVWNSVFRSVPPAFNCSGASLTGGGNVSNDSTCPADDGMTNVTVLDLALAPLADNGGWVDTVALGPTSVAVGAADAGHCPDTDGRGVARPPACDAGSYQSDGGVTIDVESSAAPSRFGDPFQLTVTVAHPESTPTGTLTIDGLPGDQREKPLASGAAAFLVEDVLAVGDHELTITYVPDGALDGASVDHVHEVVKQQSTAVLEAMPAGQSSVGETITLDVTVTNRNNALGPVPSGDVELFDGDTSLGVEELDGDGLASLEVTLDPGPHTLTAAYAGSDRFEADTSDELDHAVQADTTTVLAAPSSSLYGVGFDVEITVEGDGDGAVPTGIVSVFHGTGSGLVTGELDETGTLAATITYPTVGHRIPAGENELFAAYSGDDHNGASTSEPVAHEVETAATATTLTGPASSTTFGAAAAFTAVVDAIGTDATPTGSVAFDVDGGEIVVALVGGAATLSTTALGATVGGDPHEVVATYVADHTGFAASASDPVEHAVMKSTTAMSLTGPATSVTGESVALVATVTSSPAPSGTITFTTGATTIGTASLVTGVATLIVTTLPQGSHSITAVFAGDANHTAVTALPHGHVVAKATTTIALTSSPGTPVFGETVTLVATVAAVAPGGSVPTGFVQFSDDGMLLGTAAIDETGEAALDVDALAAGVHPVSASFATSSTYLGSTGEAEVTIGTTATSIDVAVSTTAATFGVAVTLTATVVSSTGSTPTGTVTFTWLGNDVGTATLDDGLATLTTSSLTPVPCVGPCIPQSPRATYGGDDGHESVASEELPEPERLLVSKGAYDLDLTTDLLSSTFGQAVRITADMGGPLGGRVPSASVRIRVANHDSRLVPFEDDGTASWTVSDMPAGTRAISAVAFADPWFTERQATATHDVSKANATIAITTAPSPPKAGQSFALTATVSPAATASIGTVSFFDGAALLGSAAVDASSQATITTAVEARGLHTITAVYDGADRFHQTNATQAIDVEGRIVSLAAPPSGSVYGESAVLDATVFSTNSEPPLPTGTVTVSVDGGVIAVASVHSTVHIGAVFAPVALSLGRALDVGTHTLTVRYSGDAAHEPRSTLTTWTVSRRATITTLVDRRGDRPRVGEPVTLTATVDAGTPPTRPTGRLTLGGAGATCAVDLAAGATSGSCDVTFATAGTFAVTGSYAGDARFLASRSAAASVVVVRGEAFVDVTATTRDVNDVPVWLAEEPVSVGWTVRGTSATPPAGAVEVWTAAGRTSGCTASPTGTCEVRVATPTDLATIEVRFLGDASLAPAVGQVQAPVRACHVITVLGSGRLVTPPSCNGTKFISGTEVELEADVPAGHRLVGWGFGSGARPLVQTPMRVTANEIVTPRFDPICATLVVRTSVPVELTPPTPAPNCDNPITADYRVLDLDAVRAAEVSAGSMRYRVGTEVMLPSMSAIVADGERVDMTWSGDGVRETTVGLRRRSVVTVDNERIVTGTFVPACRRFVIAAPPGASARITGSRLAPSRPSTVLAPYLPGGQCVAADGSIGYLTGTQVSVRASAPVGDWFDRFGDVVPLERLAAPTGPEVRPTRAGVDPATTATFTVPAFDAGVTVHTATMRCVELKIAIRDAVAPSALERDGRPPTVTTAPAANCPARWLRDNGIVRTRADQAPQHWYVVGTEVTLTASTAERYTYVDAFQAERPISFRSWSGGVTGTEPVQTVRLDAPTAVTAEWHVGALCVRMNVRGLPTDGGEVLATGLDSACPPFVSAGGTLPQTRLGSALTLAARARGSLVPIWQVEGDSVSSSTGCRERTAEVAERTARLRAEGLTRTEAEDRLMELGFLPGWSLLQVERTATELFRKGLSQARVIEDLKAMGLLTSTGSPTPDYLRANPCASTRRDTVLPAGQQVISFEADGNTTATAWFCKPVIPAVVVYDVDGARHDIPAAELDTYRALFQSKSSTGVSADCPIPGYYLFGTTPIFGASGGMVDGFRIESWSVDGVVASAPEVRLPITVDGAPPKVEVTLRAQCHALTVTAQHGSYADPKPNCPFADPKRNLYIEGTTVVVGAEPSDMYVWQGWGEEWGDFNPVVVTMDQRIDLVASFRHKTIGEGIQTVVVDPLVDGLAVGAKKVVGGIAFMTKIGAAILEDALLRNIRLLGEGLGRGLEAIGLGGAVVDGIVLGLTQPHKSVSGAFDSLDCVTVWALGMSAPTPGQLAGIALTSSMPSAERAGGDLSPEEVIGDARALADRAFAGDPEAIAQLTVSSYGGGALYAVAKDMYENPDAWVAAASDIGVRARDLMDEKFNTSNGLTWESSAADAWTTGGEELGECIADSGRTIAGQ